LFTQPKGEEVGRRPTDEEFEYKMKAFYKENSELVKNSSNYPSEVINIKHDELRNSINNQTEILNDLTQED